MNDTTSYGDSEDEPFYSLVDQKGQIPVMESCIIDDEIIDIVKEVFPIRKKFDLEILTLNAQIRRESRDQQIKTFKRRLKMGCSFNIFQSPAMVAPMSDGFWARLSPFFVGFIDRGLVNAT